MRRDRNFALLPPKPVSAVVDPVCQTPLARIGIHGGYPLPGLSKGHSKMHRQGGLSGSSLFISDHDDMRRDLCADAILRHDCDGPCPMSTTGERILFKKRARAVSCSCRLLSAKVTRLAVKRSRVPSDRADERRQPGEV